jgi:hypothetical protein
VKPNWRYRCRWQPCFSSSREARVKNYRALHAVITALSRMYPGWTRTEILDLTPRERFNAVTAAAELRRGG